MRRHVTSLAATTALAAALVTGGCQSDEQLQPRGIEDYRTHDIGADTTSTGTTGINPALQQQAVSEDEAVRLRSAGESVDIEGERFAQPQRQTAGERQRQRLQEQIDLQQQQQAQPAGQQEPRTNFEGFRNEGEGEQSVPSGAPGDMEGADTGALPQQQAPAGTGTDTGTGGQ